MSRTNWISALAILAAPFMSQPAWAVDIPAVLQWSQRVEMSVPVSGVVQTVNVQVGDRVKKGQVLLSLDSGAFLARVAETQATINRFKEEAAEAGRNLKRTQELYDRTVISTTELEQAKLQDGTAKARVAQAEARLKVDQKNLSDSAIRAPFDGLVVGRNAEPGQTVASGLQPQTLLTLARSGEMIARANLFDTQMGALKAGQKVTVVVGSQSYPGKIKVLGLEPVKAKDEVTYPVDVVFATNDRLRAGMPAKIQLP